MPAVTEVSLRSGLCALFLIFLTSLPADGATADENIICIYEREDDAKLKE